MTGRLRCRDDRGGPRGGPALGPFAQAQERLPAEGMPCQTVVVTDGISSASVPEIRQGKCRRQDHGERARAILRRPFRLRSRRARRWPTPGRQPTRRRLCFRKGARAAACREEHRHGGRRCTLPCTHRRGGGRGAAEQRQEETRRRSTVVRAERRPVRLPGGGQGRPQNAKSPASSTSGPHLRGASASDMRCSTEARFSTN